MAGRKKGEQEAITILESLGIGIDKTYHDDNSHDSMPDIRCKDGRYIEVTHTYHNNAIPIGPSKFDQIQPGEDCEAYLQRRLKVEDECGRAIKRCQNLDYEKDDKGIVTPAGQNQYKKDAKLIKEHLGFDVMERDFSKQHSEFKCDHPSMEFSTDNILREVSKDKGAKYPDGTVDLFIFVTSEEYRLMKALIPQQNWNGMASVFLKQIYLSPFPKVYVCEWYFMKQEYNTESPQLTVFCKCDQELKVEWHNNKE